MLGYRTWNLPGPGNRSIIAYDMDDVEEVLEKMREMDLMNPQPIGGEPMMLRLEYLDQRGFFDIDPKSVDEYMDQGPAREESGLFLDMD